MSMIKRYSELAQIIKFNDRFEYLVLSGTCFEETFGIHRELNQLLYRSLEWKSIRREIIIRDRGCDLGIISHPILESIYIHHINPISPLDITNRSPLIFDPENLICTSFVTHQAIHYGDITLLPKQYTPRSKFDTTPWKK